MKKYFKNIFLGIALCFALAPVRAQSLVMGTISDAQTGEPLPATLITNLTSGVTTTTDQQGKFIIEAVAEKDSLKISMVGFEDQLIMATQAPLKIRLEALAVTMSEIVVSTNREQEKRTEVPVAISVISATTLEDNKPTTIDQVLNQTPGVNMVDLGNEQHTMSIRRPIDYGASYLYLEDGIPIRTSGVFNHNALLEINMANTGRIEIIRGPASSLYGSEAIGGAVNFISKKPSVSPTAGISLQGNDIGYRRTDFYASTTVNKKLGIRAAGYYAFQNNGTLAYSDFNKLALSLSANYYISEYTDLSWSSSWIDYYSDMSGSLDSADFYSKSYGSNHTFTNRQVDAFRTKLALNHAWNPSSKTNLTTYFRSNSVKQNPSYRVRDDFSPRTQKGDPSLAHGELNDNRFKSYGLITQHKQDFSWLNASLIVGLSGEFSPNAYEADYIRIFKNQDGTYASFTKSDSSLADYQADLLNLAGYIHAKIEPLKNLSFIAALRYDNFNYDFNNNLGSNAFTAVEDTKNNFNRFTPKLGLTFDLQENRGLYANFSQGFVPPQVTEFYVGRKLPTLLPVYYNNYELGGWLALARQKAKLEVSLYRMDGFNEIISVLLEDNSTIRQNAGRTTHQGIEYALYASVGDFTFRFSGTNSLHKFKDYNENGKDFSGKDMPQAPNWIANSQITYKPSYFKGFRASLEWQYIDKYFMDPANTKTYEGYDIFNVRLGYQVRSFEIWANIINAGNELYATVARATAFGQQYSLGNPRNINLGISYKFQKN